MTKKGIWATVIAVIGAICVIVALCVIGAHINKQKPAESDKVLTAEDENGSKDEAKQDENKEQAGNNQDQSKTEENNSEQQNGSSGQEGQQSEQPNQQQEQSGQDDEQGQQAGQTEQGDQTGDETQNGGEETQNGSNEGDQTSEQNSEETGDSTGEQTGEQTGDDDGDSNGEEQSDQTGDTTSEETGDENGEQHVEQPGDEHVDEPVVIKLDTVGDVNTDGVVNDEDVYALKVYLDGTAELEPQQMLNADVNKDGIVNAFDKKLLSAYIINAVKELPLKIAATAGDLNGDKVVNVNDIKYWNSNIDSIEKLSTADTAKFDVNGDKFIDYKDYELLGELVSDLKVSKHTVLFEGNYQDAKTIQVEVKDGNLVNNIVPASRDRFDFDGWYKDAKCTVKFDFNTVISHDIVLYGKWTALNYVSFVSEGVDTITQPVRINESVANIAPKDRAGYEFDGWFTDKKFTKPYDFATPVTSDFSLYAKWTKIFTFTFVDKFYTHDGEHMVYSESKITQKVRDGEKVTPVEKQTRRLLAGVNNGYAEFKGWSADKIDLSFWKADSKLADK